MSSVKNALLKYHEKQLQKNNSKRRKNKKPEKQTEKECLDWMREHGFSVHIVESKAVYSTSAGRYLKGQTVSGFIDCCGCDPNGFGVFVEFKARGRRSTLRDSQREFLKEKILKSAFGCVIDRAEQLAEIYRQWCRLKRHGRDESIAYLLEQIPKKKPVLNNNDLF